MYAQVILTKHAKAIDMAFTYKVPEQLQDKVIMGQKVIVPFGRGSNLTEAFILSFSDETDLKKTKINLSNSSWLLSNRKSDSTD